MFRIRHTGIVTNNLRKSLKFYKELLRLKILKQADEKGDFIDIILGGDGIFLKTVKLSEKIELLSDEGQAHVAFTVNNLDKEYERLRNGGIVFSSPPQVSPDKKAKVAFCYSPENTLIELVEDL